MKGDWRRIHSRANRTFADKAIEAHICRGCGLWMDGRKPPACPDCGRMDFDSFPSKGEAKAWMKLRRREINGEIDQLERQVQIPLLTVHHETGKPVRWGTYVADFRWRDVATGQRVTAECKPGGAMTYEAELKIRCVEAQGIPVEILT